MKYTKLPANHISRVSRMNERAIELLGGELVNLEQKIAKLNLLPMTDEVYLEHLKSDQLRGMDVSKWEYYKMYGNEPMFYDVEYLNNTALDELI